MWRRSQHPTHPSPRCSSQQRPVLECCWWRTHKHPRCLQWQSQSGVCSCPYSVTPHPCVSIDMRAWGWHQPRTSTPVCCQRRWSHSHWFEAPWVCLPRDRRRNDKNYKFTQGGATTLQWVIFMKKNVLFAEMSCLSTVIETSMDAQHTTSSKILDLVWGYLIYIYYI